MAAVTLKSVTDRDFSKEFTAADIFLSFLLLGFSLTSKDPFLLVLPPPPQLNAILGGYSVMW